MNLFVLVGVTQACGPGSSLSPDITTLVGALKRYHLFPLGGYWIICYFLGPIEILKLQEGGNLSVVCLFLIGVWLE